MATRVASGLSEPLPPAVARGNSGPCRCRIREAVKAVCAETMDVEVSELIGGRARRATAG
jgi:hypothetical protein